MADKGALSGRIWFVGGPLDNQILFIHPWRVSMWLPVIDPDSRKCSMAKVVEHHTYRLEKCATESAVFFCYAHGSIGTMELRERVLGPAPVLECPRFGLSMVALHTAGRRNRVAK